MWMRCLNDDLINLDDISSIYTVGISDAVQIHGKLKTGNNIFIVSLSSRDIAKKFLNLISGAIEADKRIVNVGSFRDLAEQ